MLPMSSGENLRWKNIGILAIIRFDLEYKGFDNQIENKSPMDNRYK